MSRNEAVSPLRINKTPTASPAKSTSRPLSEIGSGERRRNSPSFDQTTKRMYLNKGQSPSGGSSPFQNSPRLFWKEHTNSPRDRFENSENSFNEDSQLPLSPKRNSIENLKKQARVKNSGIFAKEQMHTYDPTLVQPLDRPLAAGRPLSTQIQGNAFGGAGLHGLRHSRGDSVNRVPVLSSIQTSPANLPTQSTFGSPFSSPTKDRPSSSAGRASPTKSSLVNNGRFNSPQYNSDGVLSSDDEAKHQTPRALRRHAKSVTFDAAPPTITEYELVTPDPSAASGSREGSYVETDEEEEDEMSFDDADSFDASLEDTDKTPVVLPEDWRHVSPDNADADHYDDVYEGRETSPMAGAQPSGAMSGSRHGSEGSPRPLPPIPGMNLNRPGSSHGETSRALPQLPPVSGFSKADLMSRRESSMSLEDRLRLMNFGGERDSATPTQDNHHQSANGLGVHVDEMDDDASVLTADNEEDPSIPRISRESILRRVKSQNFDEHEEDHAYDAEASPERSYGDLADLDPDVPIPSRECSSNFDEKAHQAQDIHEPEQDSVLDADQDVDGSAISHLDDDEEDPYGDDGSDCSVIRHPIKDDSDGEQDGDDVSISQYSQYSSQPDEEPYAGEELRATPVAVVNVGSPEEHHPEEQPTIDTSGPPTPTIVADSPSAAEKQARQDELFANFDREQSMDLSLDPLKASFATAPSPLDTAPKLEAMRSFIERPDTPDATEGAEEEYVGSEPGSPGSVIQHPIAPPEVDSDQEVPQREATIRGTGGHKLRTRPSLIPDEIDMAATRRQVSGTYPPPIPERSDKRQSLNFEIGHVDEGSSQLSVNSELRMLDLDLGEDENDLSFGLDNEFDKIIESQKKGYKMRENTKVVVASNRQYSDEARATETPAAADPATGERIAKTPGRQVSGSKQAWTTEPWNGKARRKSLRTASGTRKPRTSGVAPPLPGQESAVTAGLDAVNEQGDDEFEDGEERGRVFVKVVGVKDLDLPLPKTERTWFQLTLDNGLHCVTTSWLELGHSAPIGQEFELVVLDDLEFQLTLQTKLEPPARQPEVFTAAPPKVVQKKTSGSTFRNFLSSPKKRKEQERRAQEEADREALKQQQEAQAAAKRNQKATAWDLLHDLVGQDGSFARAYVCLGNYENQAYGRPLTVDIPCFNEWAVDDSGVSSVKSKRGGVVRRPPYRVGKLTVQLLYVPKPKNATDDDMPKSLNACIRELKEAEEVKGKTWEGHLSQQGGDCPYWRRRFFRLDGTKLTAYHETTMQRRAVINLAKATKLLDDKSSLKQSTSTKSGGRRKSAFAEDEEGYMFVEEGFRIRFANGEAIDFYASDREQKEGWMKVLSECVGKDIASGKAWTHMVLEKERKEKAQPAKSQSGAPVPSANRRPSHGRTQSHEVYSKSTPSSPAKPAHARTQSFAPTPPPKERDPRMAPAPAPRPRPQTQVQPNTGSSSRRDQVRSMIF
ncbi:Bud site selection protein bud4 [Curvularia kusanoi]|uniref:Bud site selection protein bud4 n=1 Tax=Curvularia kusanoi TaxID=90978 RepID=A0A9P4W4R8_CURKU|nr:Bud site selection protein bud4 [Curvularia kusanoi]